MSTFYRFSTAMAVVVLILFVLASCSKNKEVTPKVESITHNTSDDKISDEVKAQFVKLGYDVRDLTLIPEDNPFTKDTGQQNYLLQGDIVITPQALQEMMANVDHTGSEGKQNSRPNEEQYRTPNLVSGSPGRTIRVLGLNLDAKMQTGLTYTVANYNALYGSSFGLKFSLIFSSSPLAISVSDIVVSQGLDQSGYPSGGNPYKWVKIMAGTGTLDELEHRMTHHIGHCLGLRHSDYFNTALSCGGSPVNEGSAGVGAIYVPGTPVGYDPNSLMNKCHSASTTGEFGAFDITALKYLY